MTRKLPLFVLVLSACVAPVQAAPAPLLVCYPGGPVNENDANSAMASMLRVVERLGQWPANSFTSLFTAKADECRKLLADKQPGFAITSLGLYLEQREAQHLTPLLQPVIKGVSDERYRIVAQPGKFKTLDDLKGKSLGGTVLEEPNFIQRIVFAGKVDPAAFFALKPSRQAIRALRTLDSGELDAVMLNEQQYAALGSLPLKNPPEVVFTSDPIPLMGLAANTQTTSPEDRARFVKALTGLCTDSEGKKLCELFGIDAFVPEKPDAFTAMVKLWNAGK